MSVNASGYSISVLTASMGDAKDGVGLGYFTSGGKFVKFGGWSTGTTTFKLQYSSPTGVTWTAEADAPWTVGHVFAIDQPTVGGRLYKVNGDAYTTSRNSHYTDNGISWTLISADCGLGDRFLGALKKLGSDFFYIGGQTTTSASSAVTDVYKSTDNCASFTKVGDLPFKIGQLIGNCEVFNGRIWIVGGTRYDSVVSNRTFHRDILSSSNGTTWTNHGKMPYPWRAKHYSQMKVYDNILWLMGGYHGFTTAAQGSRIANNADIWASDNPGNPASWTQMSITLPAGVHAFSATVGTDGIYGGFGTSDAGLKDNFWKITKI